MNTYLLLSNEDDTDIELHGPCVDLNASASELLKNRRPFSTRVYSLEVDFENRVVKLVEPFGDDEPV